MFGCSRVVGWGRIFDEVLCKLKSGPAAVLGRIIPAESIVAKELVKSFVRPSTSRSERRGILGRYRLREVLLRDPELPLGGRFARHSLEAAASACLRSRSASSRWRRVRFLSSMEWYAFNVPGDTPRGRRV